MILELPVSFHFILDCCGSAMGRTAIKLVLGMLITISSVVRMQRIAFGMW